MITARDNFKKFVFRVLQFLPESQFSVFRRTLGNFITAFRITQYYYNIKISQKNAAQSIFRKFRIYSFSWNLDFRTLEKNLTIFQLQRILHAIMIISKVLIMTTARTIYRKICNVRNLAFYNICQNLGFQLLEKDWATL